MDLLDLLEPMLLAWRLCLGLALTVLACVTLYHSVHGELAATLSVIPPALLGMGASVWWQFSPREDSR